MMTKVLKALFLVSIIALLAVHIRHAKKTQQVGVSYIQCGARLRALITANWVEAQKSMSATEIQASKSFNSKVQKITIPAAQQKTAARLFVTGFKVSSADANVFQQVIDNARKSSGWRKMNFVKKVLDTTHNTLVYVHYENENYYVVISQTESKVAGEKTLYGAAVFAASKEYC